MHARNQSFEAECAIAQAAAVVGEWWTLLILRDVAGGINRFDELQAELKVSRKVLSERLTALVGDGVLATWRGRGHQQSDLPLAGQRRRGMAVAELRADEEQMLRAFREGADPRAVFPAPTERRARGNLAAKGRTGSRAPRALT